MVAAVTRQAPPSARHFRGKTYGQGCEPDGRGPGTAPGARHGVAAVPVGGGLLGGREPADADRAAVHAAGL